MNRSTSRQRRPAPDWLLVGCVTVMGVSLAAAAVFYALIVFASRT